MKTQHKGYPFWVFAYLLPLMLSGCASVEEVVTNTPEPILTDLVEVTPTKRLEASPTASLTLTPARAGTPTSTSERTQPPTPTHIPPDEVREWISKRLVDNGGCRLPCWWGITPGKTSWDETNTLLTPYTSRIRIIDLEDHFNAGMFFEEIPSEINSHLIYIGFDVRNGMVHGIGVNGIDEIPSLSLPELMQNYGKPGGVFVDATHPLAYSVDPRSIDVHIYYPDQGIFAAYASPIGELRNGIQQGCIEYGPGLTLVPPGQERSYTEFVSGLGLDLMFPYRPVSEALGMDVETFYNTYKGIDQVICLETPVKIWIWGDPTPTP
jgi:hypothetical protein